MGILSGDDRVVPSILKQSSTDEKQKIIEAISALRLIDKNQLEQAVQEAKMEVLAFINGRDNIANCQIAELIGLDLDDDLMYLERYGKIIITNYDIVSACLTKHLG